MSFGNPFSNFAFGEIFDSVLPDFVLAFTFFTALIYAVLGKRFGQQRPAIAASAALGLALSVGLVWWEQASGMSIRNLGPVAVGFAVLILAGVIHQAVRQTGGNWAGAGIALGASLLVAWILGTNWPVPGAIVQTVILVAMIGGVLAFFVHSKGHSLAMPAIRGEADDVRHDMSDLYRDRQVSSGLKERFHHLRKQDKQIQEHPEKAQDIMTQLQKMLPAEGYLTERLAQLRAKAHAMKQGHIARIEKLESVINKMPPEAKKKASEQLAATYKELRLDVRIERFDKAVAENERRVRQLTQQAQAYTAASDYPNLHRTLKQAEQLQKHNSHLLRLISQTEKRLEAAAARAAKNPVEVNRA